MGAQQKTIEVSGIKNTNPIEQPGTLLGLISCWRNHAVDNEVTITEVIEESDLSEEDKAVIIARQESAAFTFNQCARMLEEFVGRK